MIKQPTYKAIFKLALPALVGGIVEPVLSLTDLAVVGNIGADDFSIANDNLSAVAAVGLAGSLLSALVWIFAQMKSAISAIVSQAFGAKRMKVIATLVPQMLYFNVIVGVIAMLLTLFTSAWIFEHLLSASGDILDKSVAYYDIRVLGFPFTLITFSVFGVFRGIQNTWWAMLIAIIGGSINILLDFIFVLGWLDLVQPMGVEGAAWASLVAQIIMFLLTMYFLIYKSGFVMINSLKINPRFGELLLIAGNLVIRTLFLNVALILTHKFANIYGEAQAATHAVVLNLWLFSAFFLDAFANAANALGGRYYGALDVLSMKRNLKRNLSLSLIVSGILSTLILLFHENLMGLLIKNEAVWDLYPEVLVLFAICIPINAVAFILDGIFKGMGKAKFLRNVLLIATLLGFLPTILIGHFYFPGLEIIWIALIAWMILRSAIPLFYFNYWIKRFKG